MKKTLKCVKLGKTATIKQYQERINFLNKQINSGRLSPETRKKATDYRWLAEQKIKKLMAIELIINKNQLILPNFLKSLDVVRIQEIMANKATIKLVAKKRKKSKAA